MSRLVVEEHVSEPHSATVSMQLPQDGEEILEDDSRD